MAGGVRPKKVPAEDPLPPLHREAASNSSLLEDTQERTIMSFYPYVALDNNSHEIRILEFWFNGANDERLDEPLEFKSSLLGLLKHVSLIDAEPYIALSYCWGSVKSKSPWLRLHAKGRGEDYQPVPITENLYSALCALWRKRGKKITLRIWVDAICINQSDMYERSQQVQMMRQIYARAEQVVAWIGPTAGSSLSSTDLEHIFDRQLGSEEAWEARKTFFNEEYWKRVWIIQEITVASTVNMLYGNFEFSWNYLVDLLTTLFNSLAPGRTDDEFEVSGIGASHLLKFREYWIDSKPISLFQAMTWTLHTKATDPRDKIFALLGLCYDGFQLVPIPNYKQPLTSVISEMSRLSFSRTRSLDLMCLKGTGELLEEYTGLPTWVPNWPILWSSGNITAPEKGLLHSREPFNFDPVQASSTNSVLKVEGVYVGRITAISTGLETHIQSTYSRQARNRSSMVVDSNQIPSAAQKVDTYGALDKIIRKVQQNLDSTQSGDASPPPNHLISTRKAWIFSTANLRNEMLPTKFTSDNVSFRNTIWRTLIMNGLGLDRDAFEIDDCFEALWTPQGRGSIYNTRIIDWIDNNARFRVNDLSLREWSQLGQKNLSDSRSSWSRSIFPRAKKSGVKNTEKTCVRSWDATNQALEQVLGSGMRLAELRGGLDLIPPLGRKVVLVHPHAECSDEGFLLKGCSTPVVLRPVGQDNLNEYEVIGAVWQLTRFKTAWEEWQLGLGEFPRSRKEDKPRVFDLV